MAKRARVVKQTETTTPQPEVIPVGKLQSPTPSAQSASDTSGFGLVLVGGMWLRVPKNSAVYKQQKERGLARDI